jgi:phosphoglucosamine mutase
VSGRLFGTDGIRARFGEEPLVEGTVRRIGAALGAFLARREKRPFVLFGGDTRASSPRLAAWMEEGLAHGGANAVDLGTLPTAAVARLVPTRGAAAGVVLSASHNPASDNGIKLIAPDGFKWSDADEAELERAIRAHGVVAAATAAGRRESDPQGRGDYLAALHRQLPGRPLAGLQVALDCAHGAASGLAAELFGALGARVETLFDRPDGANINAGCGSLHPETLAAHVAAHGHDLGFAFDGDADRALLVDERGEVRDGDAMMVLWAGSLARDGGLAPPAIVATSMSNLGLERALALDGIEVIRCGVGDREVVATLRERGLRLGGEQSGHLVDLRRSTTGDGLLTAAVLSAIVARAGKPVSELLRHFHRFPQRIDNVRVARKPPLETLPGVAAAARAVERRLGSEGRLVLRYSGTEPLARIMLEGPDAAELEALSAELAAAIRSEIGAA